METNEKLTLEEKLNKKQEQISNIIANEFNRHNQTETEQEETSDAETNENEETDPESEESNLQNLTDYDQYNLDYPTTPEPAINSPLAFHTRSHSKPNHQ